MFGTRWMTLLLALLAAVPVGLARGEDEKKKAKDEPEQKKGSVVGVLTAKQANHIEVKADGEEKARKYFPHWRGGAPASGGGLDKKMLAAFKELELGSRVRIEWVFEERLRVEKLEVLKKAKAKD